MQISDFKSIVSAFADPGTDILFEKTKVMLSVNGEVIQADISSASGDIYVHEGDGRVPASNWVINRLAKLSLLAARLHDAVTPTEYFVSPSADLLATLERRPDSDLTFTPDALETTLQALNDRSPLESTVLYITSDAGEGKTSLIGELARTQARRFIDRQSDWLLVPIPLGGRHFLRFDDITVGVLQNRYRFPFLYWDSFLALVRMGVIIPAFDGFEEMFVESSSGEALSAMGILVGSLDSQGAILVAARKAYFEFESLRNQEKLFDSIRSYSVGFAKLELRRWSKEQFIVYCTKRRLRTPDELYRQAAERLGANHALLTRAVLVRRLADVAESSPSVDTFLDKLQRSGADYFAVFVRSLIEREAAEKWIDRSGNKAVGVPLLSIDEHIELLSHVALSMWETKVSYLRRENLEFVADYYCELKRKNAFQAQQVRERLRGHAMLVPSRNAQAAVEFDHEEFKDFFLGEGIAQQVDGLTDRAKADVLGTLRRGVLPRQAQESLIRAITRSERMSRLAVAKFFLDVARLDAQTSYTQENCSSLMLPLLSGVEAAAIEINGMTFTSDALRNVTLAGVTFRDCYFASTSFDNSLLMNCSFVRGTFAQLRDLRTAKMQNVRFEDCTVEAVKISDVRETWDPNEISSQLSRAGVIIVGKTPPVHQAEDIQMDPEVRDLAKIVRYFLRSTHISESVMLMKMGARGPAFIADVVPELLKRGVMVEIDNRGGGEQRRFRLKAPLETIEAALASANGSYPAFLDQLSAVPR
jgi:hypothetical protein